VKSGKRGIEKRKLVEKKLGGMGGGKDSLYEFVDLKSGVEVCRGAGKSRGRCLGKKEWGQVLLLFIWNRIDREVRNFMRGNLECLGFAKGVPRQRQLTVMPQSAEKNREYGTE